MASRITYAYANEVENTCRKLKKNIAERRCAKDRRFKIVENPERREQRKHIGYVIQLTEQPQKNKRDDWEKAGDSGFTKAAQRNRNDVGALSGGDSSSKTDKGPSGDHRSKSSKKKETSSQTSATTKYVKITPEIIHQNEIMLSKLKRNEELLQQIKRHKETIQFLKTRIRNPSATDAVEKNQNEENQIKSKYDTKQDQPLSKPREKLVNRKLEPVQNSRTNKLKFRNVKNSPLPDIKECPEPLDTIDVTSFQSLLCRIIKAAPNEMDKNALRSMYGSIIKKPNSNTKHDKPTSPRHIMKHDQYRPLTIIKPNAGNKGNFGNQVIPTLKPVINYTLAKKSADKGLMPRQFFPFGC